MTTVWPLSRSPPRFLPPAQGAARAPSAHEEPPAWDWGAPPTQCQKRPARLRAGQGAEVPEQEETSTLSWPLGPGTMAGGMPSRTCRISPAPPFQCTMVGAEASWHQALTPSPRRTCARSPLLRAMFLREQMPPACASHCCLCGWGPKGPGITETRSPVWPSTGQRGSILTSGDPCPVPLVSVQCQVQSCMHRTRVGDGAGQGAFRYPSSDNHQGLTRLTGRMVCVYTISGNCHLIPGNPRTLNF